MHSFVKYAFVYKRSYFLLFCLVTCIQRPQLIICSGLGQWVACSSWSLCRVVLGPCLYTSFGSPLIHLSWVGTRGETLLGCKMHLWLALADIAHYFEYSNCAISLPIPIFVILVFLVFNYDCDMHFCCWKPTLGSFSEAYRLFGHPFLWFFYSSLWPFKSIR